MSSAAASRRAASGTIGTDCGTCRSLRSPRPAVRQPRRTVLRTRRGRRISRLSGPRSVRRLKIFSATLRPRSVSSSSICLVCVQRQRASHRPDGFVVLQVERRALLTTSLPMLPGAHQGVLQDGQLVRVFAHVVQHALHESRADLPTADADRALDGLASLVAIHPRDQILVVVHRFGQTAELRAITEKIRAHRQHDVDRHAPAAGGLRSAA